MHEALKEKIEKERQRLGSKQEPKISHAIHSIHSRSHSVGCWDLLDAGICYAGYTLHTYITCMHRWLFRNKKSSLTVGAFANFYKCDALLPLVFVSRKDLYLDWVR